MKKYEKFLSTLSNKDATIYFNEDLKKHCSFGVGGKAKYFAIVHNEKTLKEMLKQSKKYYIVGNGTNIVFNDKPYTGTIIKLGKNFQKIRPLKNNQVEVGGGASLFALNEFLLQHELGGLEWSFGIPGSAGGAILTNAGAFNHQIGDFVLNIKILKENKISWTKSTYFAYRDCSLKNENCVVLALRLQLKPSSRAQIHDLEQNYLKIRKDNQPYGEKSAGSVFKRIIKEDEIIYPAKIIDNLGLKGVRIKDAEISQKHAGFIVNKNNAQAKDIKALIKLIKKRVKKETGYSIEEEIIFL